MPRKGGAAKAYRSMVKTYGKAKGRKVFYATANKHSKAGRSKPKTAKGKSMHARTQSYYKKGGRQ